MPRSAAPITAPCSFFADCLLCYEVAFLPYCDTAPDATHTHLCQTIYPLGFGDFTNECIWCEDSNPDAVKPAGVVAVSACSFACGGTVGGSLGTAGTCAPVDNATWNCQCLTCPPGYPYYDEVSGLCLTGPCEPDYCWCNTRGACVPCDPPECAAELNCKWDTAACAWVCDPPTCPAGQVWDELSCSCVPDCPAGQCWCNTSASCVACPDPDCKTELHCKWSVSTCAWVCDDPLTVCGTGETFSLVTCRCAGAVGRGVDLLANQLGGLHRAYQNGGKIYTQRSWDAGVTWEAAVLVSTKGRANATPTLLRSPHDDLLVWFHDTTDRAQAYLSQDYGAAWTSHALLTATKRYPRAVLLSSGLLLAIHNGTNLLLHRSADWGVTTALVATLTGVPEQLVSLRADRREGLHLVYASSGGDLVHRYSDDDGANWTPAVTLLTGHAYPSLALGWGGGMLSGWAGATHALRRLREDYAAVTGTPGSAPTGVSAGVLGMLYDRRETIYVTGRDSADGVLVRASDDNGDVWTTPS